MKPRLDLRAPTPTSEDMAGLTAVLVSTGTEGDNPAIPPGAAILLADRALVATLDGRIIGAAAIELIERPGYQPIHHLSHIFVRPENQGTGIGRRLLEVLFHDSRHRTTFASNHPAAAPLYSRFGLRPLWTAIELSGGRVDDAALDSGVADVEPDMAASLELDLTGLDREPAYRRWASGKGGQAVVIRSQERLVGVCAIHGDISPRLAHMSIAHGVDMHRAVGAALVWIGRYRPCVRVGLCLPGPSSAIESLVASGFDIQGQETFMATDDDLVDPLRTVVDTTYL